MHDEFRDIDAETEIAHFMHAGATALDSIGSGRTALAVLLDHTDDRVRASAGAYLLMKSLMPERVVPILRDIEERQDANSAHFTAFWSLLWWEREGKLATQNK